MLQTPFEPLSDGEFRKLVSAGTAIPSRQGSVLFVSKWRDGPGMDVDTFLASLHAENSELEVRTFKTDVNIRVVHPHSKATWGGRALPTPSASAQ